MTLDDASAPAVWDVMHPFTVFQPDRSVRQCHNSPFSSDFEVHDEAAEDVLRRYRAATSMFHAGRHPSQHST